MEPARRAQALGADAARRAFTLFDEFKNFALKGNVVDLAVGVIIGAAFGKIVDSLVRNVIMPLISYVTPTTDFSEWTLGKVKVGNLLNDVISFLIIALALYLFVVKFLGFILRARKEQEATPPPPTRDQELLTEIRDLLKSRS
jgi:large conductance mechanosensitive channel